MVATFVNGEIFTEKLPTYLILERKRCSILNHCFRTARCHRVGDYISHGSYCWVRDVAALLPPEIYRNPPVLKRFPFAEGHQRIFS